MSDLSRIEASEQTFQAQVEALRRAASRWGGRQSSIEKEILSALVFSISEVGSIFLEVQRSNLLTRQALEQHLIDERARQREESDYVRSRLRDGIDAVHTLKQINERMVEQKLMNIVASMTTDLRVSITNQARAMTQRYHWETAFRMLGYGCIIMVFGFVLGRL